MSFLTKSIADTFLDERERWSLWLPVFMGLGIALYFMGPAEPPLWPALAGVGVLAALAILFRHSLALAAILAALMVMLGFAAAKIETDLMRQAMLEAPVEAKLVKGRVMAISRLDEGYRSRLENVSVEGLAPRQTPQAIHLKFRFSTKLPRLGSMINVKATLFPLSGPVEPGAFNFRRFAYFQGYGATGFALGYWHYEPRDTPGFLQRVALFFETIRNTIRENLIAHEAGRDTAVAVAMITGDQAAIPKGTLQAMRVSGISHILSVSGLHIAMVAGVVFFTLRALMALWPWMALHWPIKKIAAFAALVTAVLYTLMCAAPVPAVRAMLMSGLVLLAIMVDRRALSMRLVSFAAFLCLLFSPSALLDVSFQLSFGAVIALIAAFEAKENALWQRFRSKSWLGKIWFYIVASVYTSLIASAATAPFILYYFQQVNWYGVLTNLIAVPLSSFIIMPAAIAAVLLMPFGWESPALWVMREGIGVMLKSAEWVSLLPGAATHHPAMTFGFLIAIALGGLWLCLWNRRWCYLGLIPLVIGACGFLLTPRPDVLVAQDGVTVAVRLADGNRIVRAKNMDDFDVKVWRQRDGMQGPNAPAPVNWFEAAQKDGEGPLLCTGYDCVYVKNGARIVFPMSDTGMASSCAQANVVVGVVAQCADKPTINRAVTALKGSHALYVKNGAVKIKTAIDGVNKRPWE